MAAVLLLPFMIRLVRPVSRAGSAAPGGGRMAAL